MKGDASISTKCNSKLDTNKGLQEVYVASKFLRPFATPKIAYNRYTQFI